MPGGEISSGHLSWALFATEPAKSEPHIDAGGSCTWVEVLTGAKLWFVRKRCQAFDECDLEHLPDSLLADEWDGVLLLPGDIL